MPCHLIHPLTSPHPPGRIIHKLPFHLLRRRGVSPVAQRRHGHGRLYEVPVVRGAPDVLGCDRDGGRARQDGRLHEVPVVSGAADVLRCDGGGGAGRPGGGVEYVWVVEPRDGSLVVISLLRACE